MAAAIAPTGKKGAARRGLGGFFKLGFGATAGLATGVLGMYASSVFDKVAMPPKPVANFSVTSDGLTINCDNLASGQTGWWDFGDGTTLEMFDPAKEKVSHTYTKAGTYSVRLVVRNFLMDENERTVGVEVSPSAGSTDGPVVASLTVEPVGAGTAPAAYRVKCELKNAQQVLLDPGSDQHRPEWLPTTGTFERVVVYEQPGLYPLQVFAVNGGKVEKKWTAVDVQAPASGALSVVARVTDTGTRVERQSKPVTVAVRVPEKPAGPFERVLVADAGYAIADATLGEVRSQAARGVHLTVAPDRKSAILNGEWSGSADDTHRAAGGTDLMIPLVLTQERPVPYTSRPQPVAAPLAFAGSFSPLSDDWANGLLTVTLRLPSPPAGVGNVVRKITLDLHEMATNDRRLRDRVVLRVPELTKLVEEFPVTLSNGERRIARAERLTNGDLKLTVRPQVSVGTRASR